jgi:hypothetical protein
LGVLNTKLAARHHSDVAARHHSDVENAGVAPRVLENVWSLQFKFILLSKILKERRNDTKEQKYLKGFHYYCIGTYVECCARKGWVLAVKKGDFILEQAVKVQRGSRGIALPFL